MTEVNTPLISQFPNSFPPSPLSSASSSPLSTTSGHSRRHNSCDDQIEFEAKCQPLDDFTGTKTLPITKHSSHDLVYRRNSNTVEYRPKNKERISWKKSLSELSEKLGEICGSGSNISIDCIPKTKTSVSSHSLSSSPMNNFQLGDRSGILKMNDFSDEMLHHPEHTSEITMMKPPMRRAESLFTSDSPHKSIVVRHLETNQLLQSQLFQITKKFKGDVGKNSVEDFRDPSISNYHIHSLQVQPLSLQKNALLPSFENFSVKMVSKTKLLIRKTNSPDTILFQVSLDKGVYKNCLCFMDENKKLSLHSYPSSIVNVDYGIGNHSFIPVVMSNSTDDGGYTISIHIPVEFQLEDITVKTVDNLLSVSCIKRRTSMGRMDRRLRGTLSNTPAHHHLTMAASVLLPSSVNSRSVSAYITIHNQLIIQSLGLLM